MMMEMMETITLLLRLFIAHYKEAKVFFEMLGHRFIVGGVYNTKISHRGPILIGKDVVC